MGRAAVWLLVVLMVAGAAYAATAARYAYFAEGTARLRKDRWTGAVQVWGCVAYYVQGSESAYFPTTPDTDSKRGCARYGWKAPK